MLSDVGTGSNDECNKARHGVKAKEKWDDSEEERRVANLLNKFLKRPSSPYLIKD